MSNIESSDVIISDFMAMMKKCQAESKQAQEEMRYLNILFCFHFNLNILSTFKKYFKEKKRLMFQLTKILHSNTGPMWILYGNQVPQKSKNIQYIYDSK